MKTNKLIALSIITAFTLHIQALANETKEDLTKDSKSLGTVEIVSSNNSEDTNSYTIDSMNTSTKLNLSIKDTPQLVSVVTKQKLEDLGLTSYHELMSHITGVSLNKTDERMFPTSRGFAIDYYQIDGVPTYTISDYVADDLDLAIYDRIEIVKGANGLMTGAGNPSISMNFVRKRANSKEFKADTNLSFGSWNKYNAQIDVSTPLSNDGNIRGRFVFKHEEADTFMDRYKKENDILYGVVDMDLTDTTYLSLGASYQNLDRSGIRWGGLPAFYSDGTRTDFDRSKTVTSDWTNWDLQTKNFFIDLKQELLNDISLNVSYSHKRINSNSSLMYFYGTVDKDTGLGEGAVYRQVGNNSKKENNIDTYLSIPFSTSNLEHEIIIGAMYNKDTLRGGGSKRDYESTGFSNPLINFNYPNITAPDFTLNSRVSNYTQQTASYLVGKFSLMEQLKLITGARLTNWKYDSADNEGDREFKNEVTPYIGLVYELNPNHSLYSSYTSIFKPQDKQEENGDYLDPIVGKSYEAGLKGEYFDGKLNASFSVFRIEQDNVAEVIEGKFVKDSEDFAYRAAEGVTSKGFEIDIAGKITDNLSLDFGVANFEAKEANGDKYNTQSSRTTANLFVKYNFNNLRAGGGLNYKSKYYTGTGDSKITQDAFTIVNAMAGYKINKNIDLQLNINNVFDKKYYVGIGANSMVYGTPRNATLTLKYTF